MSGFDLPVEGLITYEKRGREFRVLSGVRGNKIFYHKEILACQGKISNNAFIEYPIADKQRYDQIVAHVSHSLHGGHGDDVPDCK